jgi:hypothetical protein
MRKVKLIVEDLTVESFETSQPHGRGTVHGHFVGNDGAAAPIYAPQSYPECPSPLCQDTPLASCDGSCRPGCVANDTVDVGGD